MVFNWLHFRTLDLGWSGFFPSYILHHQSLEHSLIQSPRLLTESQHRWQSIFGLNVRQQKNHGLGIPYQHQGMKKF